MPNVLYYFYKLNIFTNISHRTTKQANYASKTESVKNGTVCNDLNKHHTSATPKIMKNVGPRDPFVN